MLKVQDIFVDLNTFGDNVVVNKFLLFFSSFFLWFFKIITPLVYSKLLIAIVGLIVLDTSLGAARAKVANTFSWRTLRDKTALKVAEYSFYFALLKIISLAPMASVATALQTVLPTYVILREATSLMRKASIFFQNKNMEELSSHIDNYSGKLFWFSKKKK